MLSVDLGDLLRLGAGLDLVGRTRRGCLRRRRRAVRRAMSTVAGGSLLHPRDHSPETRIVAGPAGAAPSGRRSCGRNRRRPGRGDRSFGGGRGPATSAGEGPAALAAPRGLADGPAAAGRGSAEGAPAVAEGAAAGAGETTPEAAAAWDWRGRDDSGVGRGGGRGDRSGRADGWGGRAGSGRGGRAQRLGLGSVVVRAGSAVGAGAVPVLPRRRGTRAANHETRRRERGRGDGLAWPAGLVI